ncbi:outer membrane protein [Allosphingosinicella sp.]|jgi:outer membrane immunogenic protein|uniref:outer membrane protein n=1 Tax=Allosphingosinicella sp. TaxID=2823234 RepID=UPI002F041C2F
MKKLFLIALLTGATATPAFAQDADVTAADFAGFHVELIGGVDMLDDKESPDETEFLYGIGAGFDIASGNLVIGIEADTSRSTLDECETAIATADDQLCVKIRDFSIGGRIGAVVSDQALVYVKAGYTQLGARVDYDGPNEDAVQDEIDEVDFGHLDGIRVGFGFEGSFAGMGLAKVEYRYSNFENDVTRHQIVAGLGVRF